jgi:hypothetical protein
MIGCSGDRLNAARVVIARKPHEGHAVAPRLHGDAADFSEELPLVDGVDQRPPALGQHAARAVNVA